MLPSGIISLWFGSIVSIPTGWVLCDGNNGTPDLVNRFVVGAGGIHAVDDVGGSNNHTHNFTSSGHLHNISAGVQIASGTGKLDATTIENDFGTTDPESSLPPFHALAYIMKT